MSKWLNALTAALTEAGSAISDETKRPRKKRATSEIRRPVVIHMESGVRGKKGDMYMVGDEKYCGVIEDPYFNLDPDE